MALAHHDRAWRAAAVARLAAGLLLAQLLFAPALAVAQPAGADLHYRAWTTEEGLPQGSVRAIAQTADGYLWLATLDGLVRFDGVRMTVLTNADVALPSNRLTALQVDRQDALWIGTEDSGIVKKTASGFRTYGPASGLPPGPVFALATDREGRLWASTTTTWLMLVGERWVPAVPDSLRGIGPLPPDVTVPAVPPGRRREQREVRWTTDQGEGLWVLDGGLLHQRERGVWQTFPTPVPALALPAPNGLFVDREGSLWIGCEQGLVQASLTPVRALVPSGPPDERNVYTVAGDTAGRVWITTQSHALLWEQGTLTSLATKAWWPPGWMTTIEPDVDGSVLAAGPDGFFRVWPGRSFEPLPRVSLPHDFHRDRRGTLWLAAADGLYRLVGQAWQRVEEAPTDARVILEGRDGALWVGTYNGLARVTDRTTRVWTAADGLSSNRIRALHEDENSRLWIGTYDGGLNLFARDRFVTIRRRDGLFDDGVFAIVDGGDGRYYMTSNRGVHSVATRDLEAFVAGTSRRVSYTAWRSADGLPSSECNGWRQPSAFRGLDGTLWFPTQKGIAVLHPGSVPLNSLAPPVVVEEVLTERRTITSLDPVVLAPDERRVEVRFTANTFVRPERARFRHRLEGFDDEWVEAGTRRFAQYNDLPPGRYVLSIVAANSDGVWSPLGVKLPIQVEPAVWQTWWFRGGAVLLVLAGLGGFYQRRVSPRLRRRAAQDAFARHLLESQEAERQRIAEALHDGIGQTLGVIRNRALLGLRGGEGVVLEQQVEAISSAAGHALDEVRTIAEGLRPSQLDRVGLKRAVDALAEQAAAASGLTIGATVAPLDGAIAPPDEIHVYRIVQEGVANLVRHARATTVRVAIEAGRDGLTIRIEDDGVGFDPAAPGPGDRRGLTGIAERVRLLGGSLDVRSAPGQGTSLVVRVPRPGRRPRTP